MSTSANPACNNAIIEIGDYFCSHLYADFANYMPDFFLQMMDALWINCIHLNSHISIKKITRGEVTPPGRPILVNSFDISPGYQGIIHATTPLPHMKCGR